MSKPLSRHSFFEIEKHFEKRKELCKIKEEIEKSMYVRYSKKLKLLAGECFKPKQLEENQVLLKKC